MAEGAKPTIKVLDEDLYLVQQQIQKRYVKFVVLNRQWNAVSEIRGQVVSGNINIDANNNIRRTANLEMIVAYESMEDAANFVMQNYIQLWCGIEKNTTRTVQWYNQGIYIVTNNNYKFDAKSRTLSVTLSDLMTDLNGDRGGTLHAYTAIAKNSETISSVIRNVLSLCNYPYCDLADIGAKGGVDLTYQFDSDYAFKASIKALQEKGYPEEEIQKLIEEHNNETIQTHGNMTDDMIPYDLNFSAGVTGYEIIDKLVSLYPYYRMRFDVDGYFIVDEVLLENNSSQPLIDANTFDKVIISEEKSIDWTEVKNHIEVWGKDGLYYGEAIDDNPLSPFNEVSVGTMRKVYSGDIYDNIYDRYKHPDKVAEYLTQQAEYEAEINRLKSTSGTTKEEQKAIDKAISEAKTQLAQTKSRIRADIYISGNDMARDYAKKLLYETCRINDALTLQTVFLPFINDVDFKIEHRSRLDNQVNRYILKGVSHDLKNCTSTLTAVRFYDQQNEWEYTQLETPVVRSYSVNRMSITFLISFVPYATTYSMYVDGNVVDITNEAEFTDVTFVYTIKDTYEGKHTFRFTASATGYRESNLSEPLVIEMKAGEFLIDDEGNEIVTEENEKIIVG